MEKIILFCEDLKNRAGIERMTVELANLLSDIYDVLIITINPFSYIECPFRINQRVRITSLNSKYKKGLFDSNKQAIAILRKVVLQEKPKAVITIATPLVRFSAPALRGLKIKNIGWEHFNLFAGSKLGTIFKLWASWRTSATVALTEADARAYKKFFSPNIHVIPNFTSIGSHAPSKCENKTLLAVGRHARQKGFDMLIKAWAKTHAPGWVLRIVGSGKDKKANETLAQELGLSDRIEFKEATPEITKEFQAASCFVLSSRFEGLVLVLIEAKMMGLPCISFDCPESPKEIIRNGVDGWLVPPEDIESLAKELTFRLSNHSVLKEAGGKARKDAMRRYSPESVKEMWMRLIE